MITFPCQYFSLLILNHCSEILNILIRLSCTRIMWLGEKKTHFTVKSERYSSTKLSTIVTTVTTLSDFQCIHSLGKGYANIFCRPGIFSFSSGTWLHKNSFSVSQTLYQLKDSPIYVYFSQIGGLRPSLYSLFVPVKAS